MACLTEEERLTATPGGTRVTLATLTAPPPRTPVTPSAPATTMSDGNCPRNRSPKKENPVPFDKSNARSPYYQGVWMLAIKIIEIYTMRHL